MRKNWIYLVLVMALFFSACKTTPKNTQESSPDTPPRVPPVAQLDERKEPEVREPGPSMPSAEEIEQMKNEIIVLDTDEGIIKIQLYPEAAPMTCFNFRNLVEDGFYDGIIFHRVIKDFMIQSGGETPNMPKRLPYQFKDEINPEALGLDNIQISNLQGRGYQFDYSLPSVRLDYGIVAMANAGANTNGSQFFIITKSDGTEWLNGAHTGFGKVVEGMDVVMKISQTQTSGEPHDRPINNIMIRRATITEK